MQAVLGLNLKRFSARRLGSRHAEVERKHHDKLKTSYFLPTDCLQQKANRAAEENREIYRRLDIIVIFKVFI